MTGNKEKDINDPLFLAFVGQMVAITTNLNHTITEEVNGIILTETKPVFYEGILLDLDRDYYYLGKTPHEITQAVSVYSTVHIMVIDDNEIFKSLLKQIPGPQSDSEIN